MLHTATANGETPAGLRYVSDALPGIRRERAGDGFRYRDADGKLVRDRATLNRIAKLAIPPAYTDVWICASPHGHVQATGRDARGRKQYRYHADWSAARGVTKFDRMRAFARALPKIRRAVARDLQLAGLTHRKVVATVVRLLEQTLVRVGNEEYATANNSYGLTTLRSKHAAFPNAQTFELSFVGKSGTRHRVRMSDRRLARIVRSCRDLPGQRLFQYVGDDDQPHAVESADVNAYLREVSGEDLTAKDFRTWFGTVEFVEALRSYEATESNEQRSSNIRSALQSVAQQLRNTVAVCKKAYVHPGVLEAYADGTLSLAAPSTNGKTVHGLKSIERLTLRILPRARRRAKKETAPA
ncbi:MAG: DNA topoisomerase IB [Candidatus Eremiobacteraeota bacterium]|nr:DNA topoisomerase IB [Candidatus Eremiobacteraeota bacterium]MBV8264432.1 DNA topoisomerase IB [Candidatus Eremiobacteraeota bacterium]MBV8340549.1 DNA topoisomerase IB [Candidatus Eremiobacteraeota bacterium]